MSYSRQVRSPAQLDEHNAAEFLGKGLRLFLRFKVDAQDLIGFGKPITKCPGVSILRVHPIPHAKQELPKTIGGKTDFDDMEHRGRLDPNSGQEYCEADQM